MAAANKALALLLVGAITFLPNLAQAGCGVYFRHHVVPVAPVVVAPVYQVGTALEMRAEAVKAMRDYGILPPGTQPVKDDHHIQDTRKTPQDYGGQKPTQPTSHPGPNTDLKSLAPVLWAKCWNCHSGKGIGVNYWDFKNGITGDEFLRITDMIANKTNIPDRMKAVINGIKPEEYGKILDEAIKVAKLGKAPIAETTESTPPQKDDSEDYRF